MFECVLATEKVATENILARTFAIGMNADKRAQAND